MKRRVAILISGRGYNMAAVIKDAAVEDYPDEIVVVISNRADAAGLAKASAAGVTTAGVESKPFGNDRAGFEAALQPVLDRHRIELICLGGFTENIPRVLPKHLGVGIDLVRVPLLPVFKWLAEQGGVAELELLRTFNCGIGMVAIVKADAIQLVSDVFGACGEAVALLGEVIPAVGEHRVVYNGHFDLSW